MDNRPIGVFDSGVGGLTVVKRLQEVLPNEDIVYLGDTARVPYGAKSKETITRFSKENIKFLLQFNVKLIVIACNTASSLSLQTIDRSFDIPVIGVIKPGVEKALELRDIGTIGIIGTRATISSGIYEHFLKKGDSSIKVISKSCPLFVPLVEEGLLKDKITSDIVKMYLADLKKKNVKILILGCTHYPLLKPVIHRFMGKSVKLIDSADETAEAVKKLLNQKGLLSNRKTSQKSKYMYFVTDEPSMFKKTGETILGNRIDYIKKVYI